MKVRHLKKTLLKVQSALAIQQGVQGIREAIPAFKQLGKTAIKALQGIKVGIAATGIGLLVVALGTIVAYWDDITAAMGGAAAEGQKLLDQSIEEAELAQTNYDNAVKYENILRAQGKSEKFIRDLQMEELNIAIEKAKVAVENAKQQKKLSVESVKFNQKVLESVLKVILFPLDQIVRTYNQIAKYVPGLSPMGLLSTRVAKAVFDVEDASKKADEQIKTAEKNLKDLELQKANIQLKDKAERASRFKEEQDKQKEQNKKLAELEKQRLQNLEDQRNAFLDRIAQIEEENYQRTLSDEERELRAVQDKYFELETMAEGNAEALNAIEIARLNEENEIKLRYAQEAYDAQKVIDDQADADRKEREAKEKADNLAAQQSKIQFANDALSAISDLTNAFAGESEKAQKKAFKINKAIGITQAIINTAGAVSAAINPAVGGLGIPAGLPGAVLAAATGAAQIATIAKTQFQGGGGEGVDAPPTSIEATPPQFNVVGDAGINQLAQLQQQPTQAFVVSGEVTSAQALDRNRVTNATL